MSLFYGLISLLMFISYMRTGTDAWVKISIVFAVLQIMSELASAVAGYWIAKKKILDGIREGQNGGAAVSGNALSKKGANEL